VEVVGVARKAGPGIVAVAVELARLWIAAREQGQACGTATAEPERLSR
jgi:hypothetical protein